MMAELCRSSSEEIHLHLGVGSKWLGEPEGALPRLEEAPSGDEE